MEVSRLAFENIGGLCFFRGKGDSKSCRTDDLDVMSWAKSHGWTFGTSKAYFDGLNEKSR